MDTGRRYRAKRRYRGRAARIAAPVRLQDENGSGDRRVGTQCVARPAPCARAASSTLRRLGPAASETPCADPADARMAAAIWTVGPSRPSCQPLNRSPQHPSDKLPPVADAKLAPAAGPRSGPLFDVWGCRSLIALWRVAADQPSRVASFPVPTAQAMLTTQKAGKKLSNALQEDDAASRGNLSARSSKSRKSAPT